MSPHLGALGKLSQGRGAFLQRAQRHWPKGSACRREVGGHVQLIRGPDNAGYFPADLPTTSAVPTTVSVSSEELRTARLSSHTVSHGPSPDPPVRGTCSCTERF